MITKALPRRGLKSALVTILVVQTTKFYYMLPRLKSDSSEIVTNLVNE